MPADTITAAERDWLLRSHAHDRVEVLFGYQAPPNAYHNSDGDYVGVLVDFRSEIESPLGITLKMRPFETRDALIEYARQGRNLVIVGIVSTSVRRPVGVVDTPFRAGGRTIGVPDSMGICRCPRDGGESDNRLGSG